MLALLPLAAMADGDKKKENTDPKYLEGAITLSEKGKVVFTNQLSVPTMSKDKIYELLLGWSNKRFASDDGLTSKVVYADKEEGKIAVQVEEWLTFSNSALALDRTRVYYYLLMEISDGSCDMTMSHIRYWYEENRDGGQKFVAEEWITDDWALNKSKTKLVPISGKFRRFTIDLKDEVFNGAAVTLGQQLLSEQTQGLEKVTAVQIAKKRETAPETPVVTAPETTVVTAPETPVVTAPENHDDEVMTIPLEAPAAPAVVAPAPTVNEPAELKEVSLSQLPSNLSEIAASGRLSITASNGESIDLKAENWGGFAKFFNKDVAYIIIDKSRVAASAMMEQTDSFSVSFFNSGSADASVVVECKKSMSQQMSAEDLKSMVSTVDDSKEYTMYMGEVQKTSMR